MSELKRKKDLVGGVRRTVLAPFSSEKEQSELGRRLTSIALANDDNDEGTFTEADVETELAIRRGGYYKNGR